MVRIQSTRMIAAILPLFLLASCWSARVRVDSRPLGARILVNGKDSGLVTPVVMDFATLTKIGNDRPFRIEVQADGYIQPPAQLTDERLSVSRIILSVFPPILVVNLIRGFQIMNPHKLRFTLPVDRR